MAGKWRSLAEQRREDKSPFSGLSNLDIGEQSALTENERLYLEKLLTPIEEELELNEEKSKLSGEPEEIIRQLEDESVTLYYESCNTDGLDSLEVKIDPSDSYIRLKGESAVEPDEEYIQLNGDFYRIELQEGHMKENDPDPEHLGEEIVEIEKSICY